MSVKTFIILQFLVFAALSWATEVILNPYQDLDYKKINVYYIDDPEPPDCVCFD
jgi:hypothetical protein